MKNRKNKLLPLLGAAVVGIASLAKIARTPVDSNPDSNESNDGLAQPTDPHTYRAEGRIEDFSPVTTDSHYNEGVQTILTYRCVSTTGSNENYESVDEDAPAVSILKGFDCRPKIENPDPTLARDTRTSVDSNPDFNESNDGLAQPTDLHTPCTEGRVEGCSLITTGSYYNKGVQPFLTDHCVSTTGSNENCESVYDAPTVFTPEGEPIRCTRYSDCGPKIESPDPALEEVFRTPEAEAAEAYERSRRPKLYAHSTNDPRCTYLEIETPVRDEVVHEDRCISLKPDVPREACRMTEEPDENNVGSKVKKCGGSSIARLKATREGGAYHSV